MNAWWNPELELLLNMREFLIKNKKDFENKKVLYDFCTGFYSNAKS